MPSKKQVIKIYVSPEEYEEIHQSASRAGLSLSTFAKKVCLGSPVSSRVEGHAILALMRANADMARLGNLIKAILNNKNAPVQRIDTLLRDIDRTRENIRLKVEDLKS